MINFETVLRLRQAELKKMLKVELEEMGFTPVSKKGLLYAPGEIPVLLVAHLDTVHAEPVKIICYSRGGRYMRSPQGIGGDDRAGVYMNLISQYFFQKTLTQICIVISPKIFRTHFI